MKPQVNPIVPVAALVVATLAAGATMWHGLFAKASASSAAHGAVAAQAPAADAPNPKVTTNTGGDEAARRNNSPGASTRR